MKYAFIALNMLLVAVTAYYGIEIVNKSLTPESYPFLDAASPETILKEIQPGPAKPIADKNKYNIIIKRNLFKVETEKNNPHTPKETEDEALEKLEPTTLKLVLWGTVTGNAEVFAVIEDKQLRQQALYQIGDSLQGAKVKKILRNKVILFYQGKNQILEMETDDKNTSKSRQPAKEKRFGTTPDDTDADDDSADNLSQLMRQIKFRPHMTQGEPDGLMVYGIRPGSVFMQIGLRNGDIIRDINGTPIVSAEDASGLFAEIDEAEAAKLTVLRRGKARELFYEVKDNQYSIVPFSEDKGKPEDKDNSEDKDKGDEE